jgi:hypothetical protein
VSYRDQPLQPAQASTRHDFPTSFLAYLPYHQPLASSLSLLEKSNALFSSNYTLFLQNTRGGGIWSLLFPATQCVSAFASSPKSFIYRFYAESLANPFIYRIYAKTPGVWGILRSQNSLEGYGRLGSAVQCVSANRTAGRKLRNKISWQ